MKDLLEAIQIFSKYSNERNPTNCNHDILVVCVEPYKVSQEDITRLSELGFHTDYVEECFYSYRFGSC